MLYLSQVLGAPVIDPQGTRIGKIVDLLVAAERAAPEAPVYPDALLIEGQEEQTWRVPLSSAALHEHELHLSDAPAQLVPRQTQEISLAHDVLDKEVIDLKRHRTVRVNDVCLDDDWRLLGIDSSPLGLIRRLIPSWLFSAKGKTTTGTLIPWERVEPLRAAEPEEQPSGAPSSMLHTRVSSGQLGELRPADLADIIHQLTPAEGAQLIERLDDETAADTLEEVDTERQGHILEKISAERAADILQAMGPDEAADLLARLPEERAQQLLRLMTPEESEDVQELLAYEEHSAGGLMTTDFLTLNQSRTVSEALEAVRRNILEEDIHASYVYCVSDETQEEQRLLGVVSLWNLLVASPAQQLQELMKTDLVTVAPDTDPREVAEVMAKYNLLAVPVVNADGVIEGVVTVDDALDVLLPPERRRKPSRMY